MAQAAQGARLEDGIYVSQNAVTGAWHPIQVCGDNVYPLVRARDGMGINEKSYPNSITNAVLGPLKVPKWSTPC